MCAYLEEAQPAHQIVHVAAERLERRVRALHPHRGPLRVHQRGRERLHIGVHHDQALDRLLEVGERGADDDDETVEADELL